MKNALLDRGRTYIRKIQTRLVTVALKTALPNTLWADHETWRVRCEAMGESVCKRPVEEDHIFVLSEQLRRDSLDAFSQRHLQHPAVRALIHVPSLHSSPAGHFLFRSWVDGLRHLGIEAHSLPVGESASDVIERLRPNFVFSSDHEYYLNWIDPNALRKLRERQTCVFAMTVTPTPHERVWKEKLAWAQKYGADFLVSFRTPEFNDRHLAYWLHEGYDIVSIPFSANPLRHRCLPHIQEDLAYAFFASLNPEKVHRYWSHLRPIATRFRGVISGPGWGYQHLYSDAAQQWLYSASRIGLNLHINSQTEMESEINERTFILAASGICQVCDNPRALPLFFSETAVPNAASVDEYLHLFESYHNDAAIRDKARMAALREVYAQHTIFHRMDTLMRTVVSHIFK